MGGVGGVEGYALRSSAWVLGWCNATLGFNCAFCDKRGKQE